MYSWPYWTGIWVKAMRVGALSRAGSMPAKCSVVWPYLRLSLSMVAESWLRLPGSSKSEVWTSASGIRLRRVMPTKKGF